MSSDRKQSSNKSSSSLTKQISNEPNNSAPDSSNQPDSPSKIGKAGVKRTASDLTREWNDLDKTTPPLERPEQKPKSLDKQFKGFGIKSELLNQEEIPIEQRHKDLMGAYIDQKAQEGAVEVQRKQEAIKSQIEEAKSRAEENRVEATAKEITGESNQDAPPSAGCPQVLDKPEEIAPEPPTAEEPDTEIMNKEPRADVVEPNLETTSAPIATQVNKSSDETPSPGSGTGGGLIQEIPMEPGDVTTEPLVETVMSDQVPGPFQEPGKIDEAPPTQEIATNSGIVEVKGEVISSSIDKSPGQITSAKPIQVETPESGPGEVRRAAPDMQDDGVPSVQVSSSDIVIPGEYFIRTVVPNAPQVLTGYKLIPLVNTKLVLAPQDRRHSPQHVVVHARKRSQSSLRRLSE